MSTVVLRGRGSNIEIKLGLVFGSNLHSNHSQFEAVVPQLHHLPHGFTPTNTRPTKQSNCRCLRYAAFECHANLQISWESFAHTRD